MCTTSETSFSAGGQQTLNVYLKRHFRGFQSKDVHRLSDRENRQVRQGWRVTSSRFSPNITSSSPSSHVNKRRTCLKPRAAWVQLCALRWNFQAAETNGVLKNPTFVLPPKGNVWGMFSANRELSGYLCAYPMCINCKWVGQRNGGSDQSSGPRTRRGQVVLAQLPVHSDTIRW